MNPSETAFLALGLVVGAAIGAAIVEAVRHRPASRREVRVTVVPNSVNARRSSTLADPNPNSTRVPIPGSPEDTAWPETTGAAVPGAAMAEASPTDDSGALAAAAVVASRPTSGATEDAQAGARSPGGPVSVPATAVAIPIAAAAAGGASFGRGAPVAVADPPPDPAVRVRPPVEQAGPGISASAVALTVGDGPPGKPEPLAADGTDDVVAPPPGPIVAKEAVPVVTADLDPTTGPPGPPSGPPATPQSSTSLAADPCAAARTLVDERCAVAAAAREQARLASEALREAQRAYDMLRDRTERAQSIADPRQIVAAKDALHHAFRSASAAAINADETEAAAREWLSQINDLNNRAREAARQVESGGAELRAALPRLERLSVEADAARISAESADLACHEARERLAQCDEAQVAAAEAALAADVEAPTQAPAGGGSAWSYEPGMAAAPEPADAREEIGVEALVIRLLRGDPAARERIVAAMADGDHDAAGAWRMRIARLTDAIAARSIEDGFLDLPEDDPFWGLFSHREQREVVAALSALGFRYDGLGRFADGRVPAQRDLSLAVGYAGLDRMRIRVWPREGELAGLYQRATVAADEWLVHEAGDLSLGEMVEALGQRAADLADTWNAWGRLRPILLSDA